MEETNSKYELPPRNTKNWRAQKNVSHKTPAYTILNENLMNWSDPFSEPHDMEKKGEKKIHRVYF